MKPKEQRKDLEKVEQKSIGTSITENLNIIKQKTGNSPDIIIRMLTFSHDPEVSTAIVHVDGLVDNPTINEFLVQSMEDSVQEKLRKKIFSRFFPKKLLPSAAWKP